MPITGADTRISQTHLVPQGAQVWGTPAPFGQVTDRARRWGQGSWTHPISGPRLHPTRQRRPRGWAGRASAGPPPPGRDPRSPERSRCHYGEWRGAAMAAPAAYSRLRSPISIHEDFSCRSPRGCAQDSIRASFLGSPGPGQCWDSGRTHPPQWRRKPLPRVRALSFGFGGHQHSRCIHRQVHKTSVGPLPEDTAGEAAWTLGVQTPSLGHEPPAASQPLPSPPPPHTPASLDLTSCSEHLRQAAFSPESLPHSRGHFLSPSRSAETSRLPGDSLHWG